MCSMSECPKCHKISSNLFSGNLFVLREMFCRIACTTKWNAERIELQYPNHSVGSFLSSLRRWWNSPNWYRVLNMSCLFRLWILKAIICSTPAIRWLYTDEHFPPSSQLYTQGPNLWLIIIRRIINNFHTLYTVNPLSVSITRGEIIRSF